MQVRWSKVVYVVPSGPVMDMMRETFSLMLQHVVVFD